MPCVPKVSVFDATHFAKRGQCSWAPVSGINCCRVIIIVEVFGTTIEYIPRFFAFGS